MYLAQSFIHLKISLLLFLFFSIAMGLKTHRYPAIMLSIFKSDLPVIHSSTPSAGAGILLEPKLT